MVDAPMAQKEDQRRTPRPKGGMITMPFIFANEATEKLAVVGFGTNMISYLTTQLHMPLTKAANTLTNFGGTASLTPLLGAFLADSYAGRFWTILAASLVYQVGMAGLTLSAILPSLRPPPCDGGGKICQQADTGQLAILYLSLALAAVGAGGIRPCVVAFGADQFDETDPKQAAKTWRYFNWYYFVMGASILLAVTVVVWVQDNVGWGWGLGIPTLAMFLSIVAFGFGYPMYRNLNPVGSPFTRLVQVSVAAWRKRKVGAVADPRELYRNEEIDGPISVGDVYRFLDKAAIVTEQDAKDSPNLWRLNTVHRVEELKSLIRMGPILGRGDHPHHGLRPAEHVLPPAGQVHGPPPLGHVPDPGRVHVGVHHDLHARHHRRLRPGLRPLGPPPHGPGPRHHVPPPHGHRVRHLHPRHARRRVRGGQAQGVGAGARRRWTNGRAVGVLAGAAVLPPRGGGGVHVDRASRVFLRPGAGEHEEHGDGAVLDGDIGGELHEHTFGDAGAQVQRRAGGSNWLPDDDLNKGKLEYFYWLITVLQVVNFVYYLFCARMYTYKPIHVEKKLEGGFDGEGIGNGELGGIELATNKV
ncbi:unnamed protein product [Linum tenue]|uniref:Uncharacterized protein n=1 Tax=Linum tenue TaxID=586396 RepID=A0AAV0R4I5_9ROSI|nr:unnamed protein product [Linum tenue]